MDKQFAALIENSPIAPGIYKMFDDTGLLLYVGKAKDLNARLKQYMDISTLEPHKQIMRQFVAKVEWETTPTESDALILEEKLIKSEKPKYNIILTDGKMYPMLMLTKHEYPRLLKFRGRPAQKKDVFGPYPSVSALNETIKTIQKVCQIRTCSDPFMRNRTRPCLLHQIGRCSAPCMNGDGYASQVSIARRILSGDTAPVVRELSGQMQKFSDEQDYESAAIMRDKIAALTTTASRGIKSKKIETWDADGFDDMEKWLGIKIDRADVFDNSHLFGKNPVGAMIAFGRDGFIKGEYRHYKLKNSAAAGNDIAMMHEFLTRRATKDLPSLIIVDGGRAQWNVAQKIFDGKVPVIGVVKGVVRDGDEHFIKPDGSEDHGIKKDSALFLLLRRVRDEAHRFAITFHRAQRTNAEFASTLDDIEGIGPARKKQLLQHFGSARSVASASFEELTKVSGLGQSAAKKIYLYFHPERV